MLVSSLLHCKPLQIPQSLPNSGAYIKQYSTSYNQNDKNKFYIRGRNWFLLQYISIEINRLAHFFNLIGWSDSKSKTCISVTVQCKLFVVGKFHSFWKYFHWNRFSELKLGHICWPTWPTDDPYAEIFFISF